jgi:hypothetical protein
VPDKRVRPKATDCGRAHICWGCDLPIACSEITVGQHERHNYMHASCHYRRYTATSKGRSRVRDCQYRQRYGITLADYDRMCEEQGGLCKICGNPPGSRQRLAVDHDHDTGEVRGLLCTPCNAQLGWYERNRGAVHSYLERVDG